MTRTSMLDILKTAFVGAAAVGTGAFLMVAASRRKPLQQSTHPASSSKADREQGAGDVRPAGVEMMRDPPSTWSKLDEELDESFPASDPATKY